ncbi:MAG: glycosyltransferase family 39 protein [Chloroflexota bacterium]
MQEPSVLDYVKSKIYFWRGEKVDLPEAPEPVPLPPGEPDEEPAAPVDAERRPLAWRTLLALALALIAQRILEPPHENPTPIILTAGIFFVSAIGFVVLAYLRGEWRLPDLSPDQPASDPLTFRPWLILASSVFTVAAFFLFTHNLFTWLNVSLWLAGIFLFAWGFWLGRLTFKRPNFRSLLTPWNGAVLLAALVVVFFRAHDLTGVLPEPFSDHIEKLFDVRDVLDGKTYIFFPRNTGREFIQMYVTAAVAKLFGTGLSFMSLKIGTVLIGLGALPFIYLLGKEIGGKRVGLFALLLAGIAYWPNVISRVGLRFPLYPLFAAPALYYLIRGLRRSNRNDFILSGIFLGLGLHGYSSFRFVPFVVVIAILVYALHQKEKAARQQALIWLAISALAAFIIFLPLLRYTLENPHAVFYRAMTRLTDAEAPLPGPVWLVFLKNLWNALTMFQWSNGDIWVHSISNRPAVDIVSGALLVIGVTLVVIRYARQRNWLDLFLLLSIPLLLMPSILSLAFPNENPSLNRTGGAIVPVFIIVAMALDGLVTGLGSSLDRRRGQLLAWSVAGLLLVLSAFQNYRLVFDVFKTQFTNNAWNSSEMAAQINLFAETDGSIGNAWIVPYPHWVDTRLLSAQTGHFEQNFTMWPENIPDTVPIPGPKLFLLKPEDTETLALLQSLYPQGAINRYPSRSPGRDFLMFRVP